LSFYFLVLFKIVHRKRLNLFFLIFLSFLFHFHKMVSQGRLFELFSSAFSLSLFSFVFSILIVLCYCQKGPCVKLFIHLFFWILKNGLLLWFTDINHFQRSLKFCQLLNESHLERPKFIREHVASFCLDFLIILEDSSRNSKRWLGYSLPSFFPTCFADSCRFLHSRLWNLWFMKTFIFLLNCFGTFLNSSDFSQEFNFNCIS